MDRSTGNIKYSYQTNMWGLKIRFPKLNNWREWYDGDFGNAAYYLDWEQILKYHVGAGITGIELMFHMRPYIDQFFGEPEAFTAFAKERGIEEITSTFAVAFDSHDKDKYEDTMRSLKENALFAHRLGAKKLVVMPDSGYFGVGPLSEDGIRQAAALMNEFASWCSDIDIMPCIHTEFWCAINRDEMKRYIDLLDQRIVGFCLDTAQVSIMGFDIAKFYDDYHDFVRFFHLKDTTVIGAPDELRLCAGAEFKDDGDRWFWELGAGKVDFKALWRLMKKYRYRGWVSIETDGTPDPMATMLLSKYYINHELTPIYR